MKAINSIIIIIIIIIIIKIIIIIIIIIIIEHHGKYKKQIITYKHCNVIICFSGISKVFGCFYC
jgi:hypothetical protein